MEFYGISACKQNSSSALHPILMKLSKYLHCPSKTNPIENRHSWVILGYSGRCKMWNFMEFGLVNKIAPAFHPIFMKHSKYSYYPCKTNPIENLHGWVILGCSWRCKRCNFGVENDQQSQGVSPSSTTRSG